MLTPLFSTVLFSLLLVFAKPAIVDESPISVPIKKHVNLTGTRTLLERDQSRNIYLRARAWAHVNESSLINDAVVNDPATNRAGFGYTATVCISDADYSRNSIPEIFM